MVILDFDWCEQRRRRGRLRRGLPWAACRWMVLGLGWLRAGGLRGPRGARPPALQGATHAILWGSPKSHLPPKPRGLVCRRRISASVSTTSPGNPPNPAPCAQVGPLSGQSAAVGACEDLMLARTEGMEVMEPTKADYEVSAKPPPQPLQPAADGTLGCRADAPFCASCRPWCPVLRASWTSCMASELTNMPLSTGVQTGSKRGCARASISERPQGPLPAKS
jgi:hypothetical protein